VAKPLNLPFDPIARAGDLWERRWGRSPAMLAVTSIMRAQAILIAELDALLKPYDLTFARYEALVLLTFSGSGALPLSKIGERLMVHPTSVTNTIVRLENQGYVKRRPNPADGRGVLAEITENGREVRDPRPGGRRLRPRRVRRRRTGADLRSAPGPARESGRLQGVARLPRHTPGIKY
jgi:DNA-binding MarR family transcriptional regulator